VLIVKANLLYTEKMNKMKKLFLILYIQRITFAQIQKIKYSLWERSVLNLIISKKL